MRMFITGTVIVQILDENSGQLISEGRPLRSHVSLSKSKGDYYLCVINSKSPKPVCYGLAPDNVLKFCNQYAKKGKLTFQFRQPRRNVLFRGDDPNMVLLFLEQMLKIWKGEHVTISRLKIPKAVPSKKNCNLFNPMSIEHIGLDRFDNRVLNMRRLSKLVLEKCTLPLLPAQLGNLPITYFSISRSNIGSSRFNTVTFWNWMCGDTICNTLETLNMEAIKLRSLPFEIMYLKNLKTLLLADNNLVYLPHFIGELGKLKNLRVSNNSLQYLPYSLRHTPFEQLDVSNNIGMVNIRALTGKIFKEHIVDHIMKYSLHNEKIRNDDKIAQKLSALSFCSLIQNQIKFKRQDIPYTLWSLYDLAARCVTCCKYVLPEYCTISHVVGGHNAVTLIKDVSVKNLFWQSVRCRCVPSISNRLN